MIKGKLNEMGHDPRNVQVVALGDGDNLPLYLVSDVDIIKSIEKVPCVSDVTTESRDTVESLCSVLREARDKFQTTVQYKAAELVELQQTLSEEIAHFRSALQKAEQKASRFWGLSCEQILA